jgi:CBS-domain-containing membrane protein
MNAADVMTREVLSVAPEASLRDAARLMLDRHVSGLPVIDAAGALVGVITEGDVLRRVELGTEAKSIGWLRKIFVQGAEAEAYVRTHGRKVEDVMTRPALSVAETTPVEEVVELMQQRHVKRLPVVAHGRVVGVVSRADLLRAVVAVLDQAAPPADSDDAIRAQVAADLARQPWAANVHMNMEVIAGRVVLSGTILDEHSRAALRVVVENVPGVREVVDELVWMDPTTGVYLGVV